MVAIDLNSVPDRKSPAAVTLEMQMTSLARSDIDSAIQKIRASQEFVRAPQLMRFLEFVVAETMEGRADRLKAYVIGTMALGRPQSFDPSTDSIVRVEANRLRRALDDYYSGAGLNDMITIKIPAGSYAPVILLASARTVVPDPAGVTEASVSRSGIAIATLLVLMLALVGSLVSRKNDSLRESTGTMADKGLVSGNADASVPSRFDRLPRMRLAAFETHEPEYWTIAETLSDRFLVALGRFDEVVILKALHEQAEQVKGASPTENYLLKGSIGRDSGMPLLILELVDVFSGKILWGREQRLTDSGLAGQQAIDILHESAVLIASAYGLIPAHERSNYAAKSAPAAYNCILDILERQRHDSGSALPEQIACIEDAKRRDSSGSLIFSYSAILTATRAMNLRHDIAGRERLLVQAYADARTAIGNDPSSARANHSYARVLLARGELDNATLIARKALSLNPEDPLLSAELGAYLLHGGKLQEGLKLLEKACNAVPNRPEWFDFFSFAAHLAVGDTAAAVDRASRTYSESFELGRLARAIAASKTGRVAEARSLFLELVTVDPQWSAAPDSKLEASGLQGIIKDTMLSELLALKRL